MEQKEGCYRCGSEEGSVTRLCPNCTQARLEERKRPRAAAPIERPGINFPAQILIIPAVVLVAISTGYFLLFSPSGPEFALPPGRRVYKRCMRAVGDKMQEGMKGMPIPVDQMQMPDDLGGAMAQSMAGLMTGMMQGMMSGFGETICRGLQEECQRNPKGRKCRKMLEAFK